MTRRLLLAALGGGRHRGRTARSRAGSRARCELTATFDDVGDLVTGHSVQVADVRVGSITGIELTDDYQALVTMRIKDDLDLPDNSVAVLRTTSLLGEKFIELRPPVDDEGRPIPADGASSTDDDVLRAD